LRIEGGKKELFRKVFVSIPLPFSKWLYSFARNNLFRDSRKPYFENAFQSVKNKGPNGDYLEFGVFAGTSFILAANCAARYGLREMRFFAFDSFEGLPEGEGEVFNQGQFQFSEEGFTRTVVKAGVPAEKIIKVKGWYSESLTPEVKRKYQLREAAIVHIDCDLYSSTRDALAFVQDLVRVGSVVIFDDWYCFGEKKDAEQFGEERAFREWPLSKYFEEFYDFSPNKAFIMTSAPPR